MLKVLIAEDDLLMADMLEDALVDNGYEVCGIARTVEKAVELGEKHRPDLAILDLRLEGRGSGTDVADALKRQGRVGVLYATGHITTIGLTSSDGEACIAKPYRIEDIVRGLEIVEQIVLTGESSGPIPKGFTILPGPGEGISPSPEFTGSSIDEFPNFSATEFSVLARRMRLQQTELLSFSDYALSEPDLGKLMSEGTRVCAACLGVSYCTIGRFRAQDNVFVAEAPFGLHASFAGRALPIDHNTPFGRAFSNGKPVVSADLIDDVRFALPSYYAEHGIVSVLAVTIMSEAGKFGVLAVGSTVRRDFDAVDAGFLTGFGNVLGRAVNAAERGDNLKHVTDRLHDMITDRDRYIETHKRILAGKDRLLETRTVLTRELEHRVRNNLQLIYSMLTQQLGSTTDEAGVEALGKIASRVMILVGIYDQLLGTDLGRTIDFGEYLATLCSSFSSLHTAGHPKVQLACRTVPVHLGLDMVTALGLVISELVTNCYRHAFPDGAGTISIALSLDNGLGNATLTFTDDGAGFDATGKSKRHGVGLVERLMEQVGGSATLRSNHGTEWTLKFPVPAIPSAPAARYISSVQ